MDSKLYLIWCSDNDAPPAVIECYSVGQGIEYYLASHGMLSYSSPMYVMELSELFLLNEVASYVSCKKCDELDKVHVWEVVKEDVFVEAVNRFKNLRAP